MAVLVRNLVKDGYVMLHDSTYESGAQGAFTMVTDDQDDDGTVTYIPHDQPVSLTEAGQQFVKDWLEAKPLPI